MYTRIHCSIVILNIYNYLIYFIFILLSEWKECAFDDECARLCIKEYMKRYQSLCLGDLGSGITEAQLKCHDFGRLHNGGPFGCSNKATCGYVSRIKESCYVKNGTKSAKAAPRPFSANDCWSNKRELYIFIFIHHYKILLTGW